MRFTRPGRRDDDERDEAAPRVCLHLDGDPECDCADPPEDYDEEADIERLCDCGRIAVGCDEGDWVCSSCYQRRAGGALPLADTTTTEED